MTSAAGPEPATMLVQANVISGQGAEFGGRPNVILPQFRSTRHTASVPASRRTLITGSRRQLHLSVNCFLGKLVPRPEVAVVDVQDVQVSVLKMQFVPLMPIALQRKSGISAAAGRQKGNVCRGIQQCNSNIAGHGHNQPSKCTVPMRKERWATCGRPVVHLHN